MFVTLSLSWGLSFLFIKVAVDQLAPLWVVAGRTTIGALVLVAVLRLRGGALPRGNRIWLHLLVLASVGNAIPWGLIAWAQRSIPSGLAVVINALVPASTLAVAAVVGIERLTARKVAGLLLALAGTVIVVSSELGSPERLTAALVVAAATVMYGCSAVYAKRFVSARHRPLAVATGQVLLATLLSAPAAWIVGPTPVWDDLRITVVASVTVLGAVGTGFAFLLFYVLIERVGATNATMVTYVMPVIGLLAGWLLLGEDLGPNLPIGAAVIVSGIWLAQRTAAPAVELRDVAA